MNFVNVNSLAILLAALVAWFVGAVWYMALAKPWLKALGKTREELMPAGKPSWVPFVISFLAGLLMAWVLALFIATLVPPGAWERGAATYLGAATGFLAWLGFVITTMTTNHRYGGQRLMLTLIDGSHWLAVLVVQGAVIGALSA